MDIHEFWKAVLSQDASAIQNFFHPQARIRWHCTNEDFSVEEFIVANCEYPGDWDGEIERLECSGDLLVTVTHVFPKDRTASFHVTSFILLKEDKIAAVDEYWADDGEAPLWRKNKHIGKPILRAYGKKDAANRP